ncbi:hypothetical protein BJY04DRAFT_217983 [Aspergillus karnatakaensis]|uniref:uncharacterized protein n=1 Tax=Aspergillus karnatakaensis TaxID=1810916 RepID=UPI003CCDCE58
MTIAPESISVLGLGTIGSTLATIFLDKGHPVTVWNRTLEKAEPLLSKGATVAKSPADCALSGTVVLISLASDEVVRDVLGRLPTLPDRTVINFTTSRPQWEIMIADLVTNKLNAAGYLHGWINAFPAELLAQQAVVRYSGLKSVFLRKEHICKALGTALWVSDDHRKMCMLENAAVFMFAGTCAAFIQALALAGAAGVDRLDFAQEALLPVLPRSHDFLVEMAKLDRSQSYSLAPDMISVSAMLDLVSKGRETAETTGVSARLMESFQALLRQAVELGKGLEDSSAVIQILRRGSSCERDTA